MNTPLSRSQAATEVTPESAAAEKLPVAVWSGELTMCGVTLHVCVLDNGQRVIEASSLEAFFAAMEGGAELLPEEAEAFARWQAGAQ